MNISGNNSIGGSGRVIPDIPSISGYGEINSEQKRLLGELRKEDLSPEEIRSQFLEKEEEKLSLLVESGKITEDEKQARLDKAESFIDKHVEHATVEEEAPVVESAASLETEADEVEVPKQRKLASPFDLVANASVEEKQRARKRRSLHRAELANNVSLPGVVDYGKLTSEQWQLIHELRVGLLSDEEIREKYLANEEEKLNLLSLSEEEKQRRLEKFTSVIDKLIENISSK